MSKILIIGAAGQIPQYLIPQLIEENHELVLFARNATRRLEQYNQDNVTLIDGDLTDVPLLTQAMEGVSFVYANTLSNTSQSEPIVEAMESAGVQRLVAASVLDIYGEVVGPFAKWNKMMVGGGTPDRAAAAKVIEESPLDYTLLRLTWLYNQENKAYETTQKGEPFTGAQVTRQAVAQLILEIIKDPTLHSKESIGVNEPNTDFDKPSFY
nr:NAD(P)H-binding protein [Mammaliicoccus sp. Marseille-Q6498]